MKLITPEIQARFAEVGDQSETKNPLIIAKFFNPVGAGTWYATEYNPDTKISYGFVTGLGYDEWGSFSIDEMESIKLPFGLSIERDLYYNEQRFDELFPKRIEKRMADLEQNRSNENNDQNLEP